LNADGTTDDKKRERFFLVFWQNESIIMAVLRDGVVGKECQDVDCISFMLNSSEGKGLSGLFTQNVGDRRMWYWFFHCTFGSNPLVLTPVGMCLL
jgi:hypothetical protein